MVVASLLMLYDEEQYPLRKLVKDCQQLYSYFQARDILSNMQTAPNKKNIERVLAGLKYKVRTVKASGGAEKSGEHIVIMDKKQDMRENLSLCYYALGITQHMVMDIVIGKILSNLSASK